nr:MAG TPA: hypothetical protein [Caudoviricetes sp.]
MEYTVANVKEENRWEEGVYQIEVTDPVVGGVDGISNKQAKQLANRTSYLKEKVDALTPAKIFEEIKKIDGTDSGLDADKLDGLDSSAFAKLGQAVPNAVLPQGDYRNVGFWRQIDAGWYWYSISIQGSNNPSSYGFVHVVKMGSECDIYWHSKGSANIFKLGFSGSDSDNTKAGWSIVTSELTIGAYPNTAVLRDANGGISAAHLSSSILTGNSATLDLSKADNFEITLTNKGVLTLANGVRGQSGVIAISNAAANITGYASNVKWRTTPTSLQSTETFAYFVWHDGYISIGRV